MVSSNDLKYKENWVVGFEKLYSKINSIILGAEAVTLQLKVSPTEEMILKLTSPPEPSRKPSVLFIGALIKVDLWITNKTRRDQ